MTNIEPRAIQNLLDKLDGLEKTTNALTRTQASTVANAKIDAVRTVVSGGATAFDAARWARLNEQKQCELKEQLTMVRNNLLDIARPEGQRELSDLTNGEPASTAAIIWLAIFGFIFAATLLSLIR